VGNWYELRIVVPKDLEEQATTALFELGTNGIRSEAEGELSALLAYFQTPPTAVALDDALAAYGVPRTTHSIEPLPQEDTDWTENWKLHFSPHAVGEHFFVCPPWAPNAPTGRTAIIIHPAMAFGTGQHATTRGCLLLIEAACAAARVESAADVGTGSGILAIALAKLGAARVYAVDNDPVACASARENAALNEVAATLRIGDSMADISEPCDLIVANLFADLLIGFAAELSNRCAPHGTIICSGMLQEDLPRVLARFAETGWVQHATQVEEPWCTVQLLRSRV